MDDDKMDTDIGSPSEVVPEKKVKTDSESEGRDSEATEIYSPPEEIKRKDSTDEISNPNFQERKKYDWVEVIQPHIKIAVIGEKGCGKSSLILAAKDGIFPHPKEKFVSKLYHLVVEVNNKKEDSMVAEIDDWGENEDFRKKLYSEKDVVFLLCFNEEGTMKKLSDKWVPELKENNVPVIFVRIEKNLDKSNSLKEGYQRDCLDLGLDEYLECCPHQKAGVVEVFQEAVKVVLKRRNIE